MCGKKYQIFQATAVHAGFALSKNSNFSSGHADEFQCLANLDGILLSEKEYDV